MKKLLFFVNPNAGHGEIRQHLMEVVQIFSDGGYDVTVYPTKGPKDLTRKLAATAADYDLVVCTGGDGTLNEAVSGLMQLPIEKRPPLGYIPGGTVNDVASSLNLSKNTLQAARDIVTGQPFELDVGSFGEDRWFSYVAGFGLFTDVSYVTPQEDKRILGRMAYLLAGVRALSEVKATPVRITCEGQTVEGNILDGLVCSTTSVGGFKPKGDFGVCLNDGKFEIVLIREIKNLVDFGNVAGRLLRMDFQNDYFLVVQSDHVRFEFPEPVSWTLDGEYGGTVREVEIQAYQKAIRIIVPK